ncbi:hypothetical protein ACK3SF_05660 [Candidatus Nanosalina sp. VS9-1]|uniref:hypothetical protein n=1 Tax=Candidatus Nanosalina sp. VS9-1 TaxID=3388566 RepID=UPI0039DF4D9F
MPHRVYGEITEYSTGDPVEGLDVSFRTDNIVGETSTDSSGYYDVKISGESGEEAYMFVNGSNTSEFIDIVSGASENLDYAGNFSESGAEDGSNETEEDTGENKEENEEETDSGSSGGGSSGGGGGGGFLPPEDDNETQENDSENDSSGSLSPPNTKRITVTLDGATDVDIGSLSRGQRLVVTVENSKSLTGLSFTAQEPVRDASMELSTSDAPLAGVSVNSGRAYSYIVVSLSGVSDYSGGELGLKVDKSWLDSKDQMSTEDVFLKGQASTSWRDVDINFLSQNFDSYRYSADFRPGSYAIGVPEKPPERADLQVTDMKVEQIANTSRVRVQASITNNGNIAGEKTFDLMQGSEVVKTYTESLEAGETRTVTFETEVEPGEASFSIGGRRQQLQVEDNSSDLIFYIIGSVAALIVLVVAIVYVIERREARKMEREIRRVHQREENVEGRMQSLRRNVAELQDRLNDDKR